MYSTRNRWESLELSQPKRERTPSRWPLLATKSTRFYRRVTGPQSIRLVIREADLKVELCDFMRKTETRRRNALAAEKECRDTGAWELRMNDQLHLGRADLNPASRFKQPM